ncbi:MAG: site-specific integrase [Deltaproteobacteria bacterium]|nr:MAG: site-specific integrase [Deltaproteobacteria bacterium]
MGVKVRERPKGSGVWWIFIDHQGKRKAKKVGKDRRLANEVAKKIEAKLVLGEFDMKGGEDSCPAFRQYAERWLRLSRDWKESTRIAYEQTLKKHVYPHFGKRKLNTIRRKDLKAFFDSLLLKGMATETMGTVRTVISGVMTHAVESELMDSNPLRDIRMKYKSKQLEVDPLTGEEAEKLLKEAKKYQGGIYHLPMLCALRTGMRIGEIQALKWGDVDFNGRFIHVKLSWRNGILSNTKNKKRRRVDMSPQLVATLKDVRVIQKRKALKQGRPVSEWVFANEEGAMLHRESFRNALNRCLESVGLRRIRVHDLRHSYATIRLLRGHNVGDVSYQLGHSSIKITYDVYGHWIPGKFKSEVDELDERQPSATYPQPAEQDSPISKSFQQLINQPIK